MSSSIVQPTIFREYIGAKSIPNINDFPARIINPKVKEFHFILAFATEVYVETTETKTGTGTFNPSWDLAVLNAKTIKELKHNHDNVKVVISIGGRGSDYPFKPSERHIWLDNAKNSLQKIIADFNELCKCDNLIDGIDINYESITSIENDFVESIGNLIKYLKEDSKVIKVASIAPSDSVRNQYRELYELYGKYIDWVDYQFYDQKVHSQAHFENLYRELLIDYPDKNLLVGFSTDPNDAGNISQSDFFGGCQNLLRNKLLPGIFVWDADDSTVQIEGNPFQLEKLAQQLLVDFYHE